jgi:branched-chain amino acid transport system ATP-binding protein
VTAESSPVLQLQGIEGGYGATKVLHGISLEVQPSSVVALLGPNGAGKTTLLRIASGLLRQTAGTIRIDQVDASKLSPHDRARSGLCHIPEGRGIFRTLTVRDNLELARPPWSRRELLDRPLAAFPALASRMNQIAGSMSGGEQQMLALARAYLSEPSVVLLDEVSMGLAPIIVDQVFASIRHLADEGVSLLIVEQYVSKALEMADVAYVINRGRISFCGKPEELSDSDILDHYLGHSERARA